MTIVETDLAQGNKPTRWVRRDSVLLGILYCAAFALMGRATPAFLEAWRGFFVSQNWRVSLLGFVDLGVTLPVALIVTSLIIWKDRSLRPTAAFRWNFAAFWILVLSCFFWAYSLFTYPWPRLTTSHH